MHPLFSQIIETHFPGATASMPQFYRGYEITWAHGAPYRYAFQHRDFDGDDPDLGPDPRCGYANTLAECRAEIDWIEDDR